MTPEDFEGALNQFITNSINGLFTSVPCRVVRVDLDIQSVDVEILVDRVDDSGTVHKHSIIMDVPLMFPSSRTSAITFPVNVDDVVLCVFSQRSIDRIKQGYTTSTPPLSFRKYSKQDAMAIPGLFPFEEAINNPDKHSLPHNTNDSVFVNNLTTGDECELRLTSSGNVELNVNNSNANIDFSIGGNKVLSLSSSEANFNVPITAPQVTTDSGVVLGTHTHPQGNDSGGSSEQNTGSPLPG